MAITRVIAQFPFWTGVPEDSMSNTFHFASVAELDSTAALAVADRLDAFYSALDGYLSPVINPTAGTYRFYRLSDPTPRVPVFTYATDPLTLGAQGYAEEVAVCISYYAAAASGQPASRRRGRIFIGPIAVANVTPGSSTTYSNPTGTMRTAFANAASVLADQSEPAQWAVYSPTDNIARQIVGGWIDNALDTQRRRGRRPTGRNLWTGQP